MAAELPEGADRNATGQNSKSGQNTRSGQNSKLGQISSADFSLTKAIGGPLGLVESVLPYAVFSIYYGFDRDLRPAIYAALVPVVVLALVRIVRREPLTQAISGVIGVGIGAFAADKTGSAANFFLPNIIKNVAFAVLYLVSILGRWPLLGVVLGSLKAASSTLEGKNASADAQAPGTTASPEVAGEQAVARTAADTASPEVAEEAEPGFRDAMAELKLQMFGWRDDPVLLAAYQRATWVWVGMFVVRVAVQTPLYLADRVTLLGLLNGLVLGVPLFALTIYLSWLLLRDVLVSHPKSPRDHARVVGRPAATPQLDPDGPTTRA